MHSGWCEIRPGSLCGWRTAQFVAARFAPHDEYKRALPSKRPHEGQKTNQQKTTRATTTTKKLCPCVHISFALLGRGLKGPTISNRQNSRVLTQPSATVDLRACNMKLKKCAVRESNPGLVRGRDLYYHCTNGACHTRTQDRTGDLSRVRRAS